MVYLLKAQKAQRTVVANVGERTRQKFQEKIMWGIWVGGPEGKDIFMLAFEPLGELVVMATRTCHCRPIGEDMVRTKN